MSCWFCLRRDAWAEAEAANACRRCDIYLWLARLSHPDYVMGLLRTARTNKLHREGRI